MNEAKNQGWGGVGTGQTRGSQHLHLLSLQLTGSRKKDTDKMRCKREDGTTNITEAERIKNDFEELHTSKGLIPGHRQTTDWD